MADEVNQTDERAEFVRGLRDLAEFIEEHPEIPTPAWAISQARIGGWTGEGGPPEFITVARALGSVKVEHDEAVAKRAFGPVELSVRTSAKDVCVKREVTKAEFVLPAELESLTDSEAVQA